MKELNLYLHYYIQDSADTDSALSISTTRVGIGTASPGATLDVSGDGRFSSSVTIGFGGSTPDLIFAEGNSSIIGPNNADFLIKSRGNDSTEGLSLQGADGAGIKIDKAGNVGIGTTSPDSPLEVVGQIKVTSTTGDESRFLLVPGAGGNNAKLYMYDSSVSNSIKFDAGGDSYINSGNVGIQETTPSKALDIKNGASGGDILCYDIYTHDGGVETSDKRLKENIKSSVLGLEFIDALNPVSYKWKDVDEIVEKKTVEKQKTVKVEKEVTRTEIVEEDGKYIQKEITETQEVDEPVFDEVPLYGEDGEQLMRLVSEAIEAKEAVLDEDGDEIEEAVDAQDAVYEGIVHKVPVMEEVEEIVNQYDAETYTRTHYGMIAQEVGQVLEDVGLESKDFAGYIYEEDRDRFGLRYNEFISPLIKAIQELSAKVEALENK